VGAIITAAVSGQLDVNTLRRRGSNAT